MHWQSTTVNVAAFTSAGVTSKTRKVVLLLISVVALLTDGTVARAQSALDGFDPNVNGAIRVVVVQPDGKILLGGDFTMLTPNGGAAVTRNRIARLNPDGTLDAAFNPNANLEVHSIVVQADGKILVGGFFDNIGGQTRNRLARLDPITGLADSFSAGAAGIGVHSIAVQADGKVLVGGNFFMMGGQSRNGIARLDATTAVADSFNPNANESVYSMAVQADGKILAGGSFTAIGGRACNRIARLDAATGLADSFDPSANESVFAMSVQADGKILVGGSFTSIGGQTRNHIARLDATTGLADSFDPNANNEYVRSIVVQADGKILAGGNFTNIGGQMRNRIARLDGTTGLLDSFDPNANAEVYSIAVQADGKILAVGEFTTLAPNSGATVARSKMARLEIDGRLDQTLNLISDANYIFATAVQPDGKILIGGDFFSVLGVSRHSIARLNTDGTLDLAFNPNATGLGTGDVFAIALQPDGKIIVGGQFMNIGGQVRNHIARLDPTTGAPDSFNPNADNDIYAVAVQADGKILAGGYFTSIGGQTRRGIARLDATTGLADSFNANAGNDVTTLTLQADGKILVGGFFHSIGGQSRNSIARLDPATALADSFNPNANSVVLAIVVQPDGKILAGGAFSGPNSIGGQMRNRVARLNPTTGLADSFNPNANNTVLSLAVQADGKVLAGGGFNMENSIGGKTRNNIARLDATTGLADSFNPNASDVVEAITVLPDGKILAGGEFTAIGGQSRGHFARLSNDTAALQDLIVTQTFVTWARGGSSPPFTRVTFEYSNDAVSYTLLGSGIPQSGSSNWTLSGLNLPSGQNFYIRARGYYRSGLYSSSDSIVEVVRNGPVGTPPPTPTPTVTPPATATPTITPPPTPTATPSGTPTPTPTVTPCSTIFTEDFDGVIAPTLPAGWVAVNAQGAGPLWGTSTTTPDTAPNAAFVDDAPTLSDKELDTPGISIVSGSSQVNFRNSYNLESSFDGAVLEVSSPNIAGGAFTDITDAVVGGSFVTGGYNATISVAFGSPIAGRLAWSGNSNGYINTVANLGPNVAGQTIKLRFRMASDTSDNATGWRIDTISVVTEGCSSPTPTPTPTPSPGVCTWTAAAVIPSPILDEPVTSVGGNIYTFSGIQNGVEVATSYRFDGATWTTIAPLPGDSEYAAAVNDGTNIYVLGGSDQAGFAQTTVYRYNVGTDSYTTLAPFSIPTWNQAAVYLNGKIYKLGGTTGFTSNNAFEIYDIASNTWSAGASYPIPISFVSLFVRGNFIYAAGGLDRSTNLDTAKTYRYDPATNTWDDAAIADLPAPRWAAACALYNGNGVLAGGSSGNTILNSVISWDQATNTWSTLPNMSGERHRMSGAVLNGSFYVVGGRSNASPGFIGTNDNQKLTCGVVPTPSPSVSPFTPTPTPTIPPTPTPTPTPNPTPPTQAINLSTRMRVQTGNNVGIGGFIITGAAPKHVLLRAIGPSLTQLGVPDALADPVLELHGPGSFATIVNNNWRDDPLQEAAIIATGIAPTNDLESAIDATLVPGAYTAIVSGNGNTLGVALFEVYDLTPAAASKLGNISTRAFVDTGNNIVIAGFILSGNPLQGDKIILRGIGPSLTGLGVPNALADPKLELRDGNGALLISNNDWQDDPTGTTIVELVAAGLAPTNPSESGIVATLPPGLYTALLSGVNNGTGVGLVEVYDRGAP